MVDDQSQVIMLQAELEAERELRHRAQAEATTLREILGRVDDVLQSGHERLKKEHGL